MSTPPRSRSFAPNAEEAQEASRALSQWEEDLQAQLREGPR
jgi:hypothetical protein